LEKLRVKYYERRLKNAIEALEKAESKYNEKVSAKLQLLDTAKNKRIEISKKLIEAIGAYIEVNIGSLY